MSAENVTPMPEQRPVGLQIDQITLADWPERCAAVLAGTGRFLALYGVDENTPGSAVMPAGRGVRALFARPGGSDPAGGSRAGRRGARASSTWRLPRAGMSEKPRTSTACGFSGHVPLRPLVEHTSGLSSWTVPVSGHDAFQVAVGPIHAGVIESGHFRFHVVGEKILHIDLRLFYKHRGLERAAEGRTLAEGLVYAQRACAACAVSNSVAYAHAAESLLGLWPEPGLARVRTILLELERLYNHLNDIGAVCAGVGFAAGQHGLCRAQRARPAPQPDLSPGTGFSSTPSPWGAANGRSTALLWRRPAKNCAR